MAHLRGSPILQAEKLRHRFGCGETNKQKKNETRLLQISNLHDVLVTKWPSVRHLRPHWGAALLDKPII